ncbi:MAG: sulfatase [Planctomycetes bacterium]|nr:sulfatase [Planctomycetota bacterium]
MAGSRRRAILLTVAATIVAAVVIVATRTPVDGREQASVDVILITLDTARADAFGCYGATGGVSPTLDALGDDGVVFERCSTSSAITPVAHASILSGLQPYQHRLRVFSGRSGYRLPTEIPTLATLLHERGYTTAAVHSAFPVSSSFGFGTGFDRFESFAEEPVRELASGADGRSALDVEDYQRRSDESVDVALGLLDEIHGPLLLWVHLFDAHDAKLRPPPEFRRYALTEPSGAAIAHRDALYADELRFQDRQLRRLLAGLHARGRLQRAVIAVVGDHGEGLTGGLERHGWSRHAILYEDQLRVPLVLRGPGVPAGRRVGAQVRTIDVMPTLLELAGFPIPASVEGKSLLALAREDGPSRIAYAEQLNGYELVPPFVLRARPHDDFVYSVSDGRWKLLYRPAHPRRSELFDLASDPGETRDQLAQQPAVLATLLRELAARDPWRDRPFEPLPDDANPQFTSALAALGYAAESDRELGAPEWAWNCIADGTQTPDRGPCPRCGAPRVLVAAGESPLPTPTAR